MSVFNTTVLTIGAFVAVFWLGYDAQTIKLIGASVLAFSVTTLFLAILSKKGKQA